MDKTRNNGAGTLDGLHKKNLGGTAALGRTKDAQERIRVLAYAIWEDRVRGDEPGDEVSDWLAAEMIMAGPRQHRRR